MTRVRNLRARLHTHRVGAPDTPGDPEKPEKRGPKRGQGGDQNLGSAGGNLQKCEKVLLRKLARNISQPKYTVLNWPKMAIFTPPGTPPGNPPFLGSQCQLFFPPRHAALGVVCRRARKFLTRSQLGRRLYQYLNKIIKNKIKIY